VRFPDNVTAGLRVAKIGRSSVRYEIGIFRGGEDEAVAEGHFVHVFVERAAERAAPIPAPIRAALARLLVAPK
jgi:acyl-CoA thioester hydrolase